MKYLKTYEEKKNVKKLCQEIIEKAYSIDLQRINFYSFLDGVELFNQFEPFTSFDGNHIDYMVKVSTQSFNRLIVFSDDGADDIISPNFVSKQVEDTHVLTEIINYLNKLTPEMIEYQRIEQEAEKYNM